VNCQDPGNVPSGFVSDHKVVGLTQARQQRFRLENVGPFLLGQFQQQPKSQRLSEGAIGKQQGSRRHLRLWCDLFGRTVQQQVLKGIDPVTQTGLTTSGALVLPLEPDSNTFVLGFSVRTTDLQYSGFACDMDLIARASFMDVTGYHRHGILLFDGGQDIPAGFFRDVF